MIAKKYVQADRVLQEIAAERGDPSGLLNLSIGKGEISVLLKEAGFTGYRLHGAAEWIAATIGMIESI